MFWSLYIRISMHSKGLARMQRHSRSVENGSSVAQDELAARATQSAELQEAQAEIDRLKAQLAAAQKAANGSSAQVCILLIPVLRLHSF